MPAGVGLPRSTRRRTFGRTSRRPPVTARYRSRTLGAGFRAEVAHPALVHRPDVVAHMVERLDVDVGSGGEMPSRNDSVPMMCDTTACTSQPGSGVNACHCVSGSPLQQRVDGVPHSEEAGQHVGLVELVTRKEGVISDHGRDRQADPTRSVSFAAIIATDPFAITMPIPCQRLTRSRSTTIASTTVAAGYSEYQDARQ